MRAEVRIDGKEMRERERKFRKMKIERWMDGSVHIDDTNAMRRHRLRKTAGAREDVKEDALHADPRLSKSRSQRFSKDAGPSASRLCSRRSTAGASFSSSMESLPLFSYLRRLEAARH